MENHGRIVNILPFTILHLHSNSTGCRTIRFPKNINDVIRIVSFSGDLKNDGSLLQITIKPNSSSNKTITFNCVNCGNLNGNKINVLSTSVSLSQRIKGDIDGNGICDIFDVIRLLKYLNDRSTSVVIENCNVDGSNPIDIFDVIKLLKYLNDKSVVIY